MFSLRISKRQNNVVIVVALALGILIRLKDCSGVSGISLAPVYWNLTNPIFKTSKNDHIIVVNLFDEIDFVCPYYPPTITDSQLLEYYLIYRVSKKEYEECNIYSENDSFLILRCTHPRQKRRFTILFEPFQSIPNVPEYKAGHTYYFMTPSTGRKNGLRNLYQGACLQNNMKLTIKVRDGDYEEEEEIHHRRTDTDNEEEAQDDEFMEYQSQEAVKAGVLLSTRGEIQRHHSGRSTSSSPLAPPVDTSTTQPLVNNLDEPEHQELSHSIPEHSASVDDVEGNFEDFLKSGNEFPSSGQTSRASSPTYGPPQQRPSSLLPLVAVSIIAFVRCTCT